MFHNQKGIIPMSEQDRKMTIKLHLTILPSPMTEHQALRYGQRVMPADMKKAGFTVVLFHASLAINGWDGIRINFAK